MMKRLTAITLLSLSLLTTACNTFEGLGQDVQRGGEKLEDVAQENK
jgi:predicted small secreted protein